MSVRRAFVFSDDDLPDPPAPPPPTRTLVNLNVLLYAIDQLRREIGSANVPLNTLADVHARLELVYDGFLERQTAIDRFANGGGVKSIPAADEIPKRDIQGRVTISREAIRASYERLTAKERLEATGIPILPPPGLVIEEYDSAPPEGLNPFPPPDWWKTRPVVDDRTIRLPDAFEDPARVELLPPPPPGMVYRIDGVTTGGTAAPGVEYSLVRQPMGSASPLAPTDAETRDALKRYERALRSKPARNYGRITGVKARVRIPFPSTR